MPDDIRLKRLAKQALHTASQIVLFELADPRLEMVTLTRVKLSSDLSHATVFWSTLGDDARRSKVAHALEDAIPVVQSAIARNFRTRRTPRIQFRFDESIEGAIRVGNILDELRHEREARGDVDPPESADDESGEDRDDLPDESEE